MWNLVLNPHYMSVLAKFVTDFTIYLLFLIFISSTKILLLP